MSGYNKSIKPTVVEQSLYTTKVLTCWIKYYKSKTL